MDRHLRGDEIVSANPYEVLGVTKTATSAELQKAYRRLAKKLHPDLNPGNKQAEEKFKEITAAYDLVSDVEKRARFDRGEIEAAGAERSRQKYYRDFAQGNGASHPYANDEGFSDFADLGNTGDIFADLFGRASAGNRTTRGSDVRYRLEVEFLDAVNGGKRSVTLADGSNIDVVIPPGTLNNQVLRLRGKGLSGTRGGPVGDALIEIEVRSHPFFTRKGKNIHVDLPISIVEAVLGGKVSVPTTSGLVTMTVPKGANTGRVLRLKGRGVLSANGSKGDEYVTLIVLLPDEPDPQLEKFLSDWHPAGTYNPRKSMEA